MPCRRTPWTSLPQRAGALTALLLAACAPATPARPRAAGSAPGLGDCVVVTLEDGHEVCVMSEPQDLVDQPAELGVSTEPLLDDLGPDDGAPLPARVDLRTRGLAGCLVVRDQGTCGWCSGATASAALDALHCIEGCTPPPPQASLPHLWASAHGGTIGDCGRGMAIEAALRTATSSSLVPESVWPFTHGTRAQNDTRPTDEQLANEGRFRASGMSMIDGITEGATSEPALRAIRRVLASGRGVAVSSQICDPDWTAPRGGVIDVPSSTCRPRYGHAFLLVGYDTEARTFLALNSWGTAWGSGGYVRLTEAYVRTQIRAAGYLHGLAGACPAAPSLDAGPRRDAGPATDAGPTSSPDVAARCAALATCGACASTSGCLFCDGRCVAASAERPDLPASGTCRATVRDRGQCRLPATDACASRRTCDACTGEEGCAWLGRGACVSWPARADSLRRGERVATSPGQCSDATGACELQPSCGGCQATSGCGWCARPSRTIGGVFGECMGGGSDGSDRGNCSASEWIGTAGSCSAGPADAGRTDAARTTPTAALPDTGRPDAGSCAPVREACTATTECCGAFVCERGACCGLVSSTCGTDDDCCDGIACVGGRCACVARGQPCTVTTECCGSDVCRAGACVAP